MVNKELMLKNIERWIDLRREAGWKIVGYGCSNGLKEIHIYFRNVEQKDDEKKINK